ncbi:hypothetical protein [Hahella ganghwensis]|uniref:hypothetical protein n=1 Tax=Hahella ganghwensis TaxID=286420 RepID=UPI00035C6C07|nr:hypothetical protein [Hahella ganghwensis]
MDITQKPLGLIDPNNLKADELFLADVHYEMFPDKEVKLFKKANHLVVWTSFTSLFTNNRRHNQDEFPLKSLPWFIDTIENKFWNHKPNPNSLPGEVNEVTNINGEKIGINPMRHCCAENLFGYSFWNKSRTPYIGRTPPQNWQIPRYMLEQGLMDELKRISTELGLKRYEPFK